MTLLSNILKLHFFTLLSNMTFNQTSGVIQSTRLLKLVLVEVFTALKSNTSVLLNSNIAMTTYGLKAPWRTVMSVLWVVTYNGEERDIV
jgi:hypothetical protein